MKGTRILRYLGNRPTPEKDLVDRHVEGIIFLAPGETAHQLLARLDDKVPDPLVSDYCQDDVGTGTLWRPTEDSSCYATFLGLMHGTIPLNTQPVRPPERKPQIEQDEFELNLVEPLVGWRCWWLDGGGMLRSMNETDYVWPRENRANANCERWKHTPPVEKCSCGFYALDSKRLLYDNFRLDQDGLVCGTVYGWGRYVRSENGFRSQYAYPRCFYMASGTSHLIRTIRFLRQYRVPIFLEQPMQVYYPDSEGYSGYWEDETHGNLGAGEEPGPAEEAGSGDCPF